MLNNSSYDQSHSFYLENGIQQYITFKIKCSEIMYVLKRTNKPEAFL